MGKKIKAEPFKIKAVEPLNIIIREERDKRIKEAYYNVFNLKADDIYIDLLTDSGTSSMTDTQWSALMQGDETYAGSKSFDRLQEAVERVLGYRYVIPTHQGRAAENILFGTLLKKGDLVPFNQPFDSTAAHINVNEAETVDCVVDIAYDTQTYHPFKGNLELEKLHRVIKEVGKEKIPFVMLTLTNNSGGGQPVSMANIKETKRAASKYDIPLYFDAARCVENAYFIKQRESGYSTKTLAQIAKEMFSYADGCTFSAKKDPAVNIGGFIAVKNESLYLDLISRLVLYEGFYTYGGLAGRDLQVLAQSLYEMTNEDFMEQRIQQVNYLGESITSAGIPIVNPIGGHAVFVDAKRMLPHVPQSRLPADALAVELYREAGVRGLGLGVLAFSKQDTVTGAVTFPETELLRLAVPRRVYTDRHMDVVSEALSRVRDRKDEISGLKITYEPSRLKHFLSRLEPL